MQSDLFGVRALVFAAVLFNAAPAAASSFDAHVIGVTDGDTIRVLTIDNEQKKIRLAEVDAPEGAQPFGSRSKENLAGMCFRKQARIDVVDTDRYGRLVGKVECGGVKVNRAQIEAGMAWVYRKYARDPSLFPLENNARAARRGLWAEANPVPPWEWRKQ